MADLNQSDVCFDRRAVLEPKKNGGLSPANDLILELSAKIHSGELKPDPSNLDIVLERLGRTN